MAWPWSDPDKQLLEALKAHDLEEFEELLQKGANPNAIFGTEIPDWVMCLATAPGNEVFLALALKHGGKVNLRNTIPPTRKASVDSYESAPLVCAITQHNKKAFDILVDKGADLDMILNPDAKPIPKSRHTSPSRWGVIPYRYPVMEATGGNDYDIVYEIVRRKELNELEIRSLVLAIEYDPIDLDSEQNRWRMKVVELLRAKGIEVHPWPERRKLKKR